MATFFSNAALHGLIWQRCSKVTFSGRKVLEIAVASAVCMLNDGAEYIANVLRKMGLNGGTHTDIGLAQRERKRKRRSTEKQSDNSKKRRKQLRAHKKGWIDKNSEKEGKTYGAGQF